MMMIVSNMCLQKLFAHCRHFGGVGNPDRLEILIRPKKTKLQSAAPYFIFNCSRSDEKGTHFIVCQRTGNHLVIFDPLGPQSPGWMLCEKEFRDFAQRHGFKINIVMLPIQSPFSNACGLHCSAFIALRAHANMNVPEVANFYAKNHLPCHDLTSIFAIDRFLQKSPTCLLSRKSLLNRRERTDAAKSRNETASAATVCSRSKSRTN